MENRSRRYEVSHEDDELRSLGHFPRAETQLAANARDRQSRRHTAGVTIGTGANRAT